MKARKIKIGDIAVFEDESVIYVGVVADIQEYNFGVYCDNKGNKRFAINQIGKEISQGGVSITPYKEIEKILPRIKELRNENK